MQFTKYQLRVIWSYLNEERTNNVGLYQETMKRYRTEPDGVTKMFANALATRTRFLSGLTDYLTDQGFFEELGLPGSEDEE